MRETIVYIKDEKDNAARSLSNVTIRKIEDMDKSILSYIHNGWHIIATVKTDNMTVITYEFNR